MCTCRFLASAYSGSYTVHSASGQSAGLWGQLYSCGWQSWLRGAPLVALVLLPRSTGSPSKLRYALPAAHFCNIACSGVFDMSLTRLSAGPPGMLDAAARMFSRQGETQHLSCKSYLSDQSSRPSTPGQVQKQATDTCRARQAQGQQESPPSAVGSTAGPCQASCSVSVTHTSGTCSKQRRHQPCSDPGHNPGTGSLDNNCDAGQSTCCILPSLLHVH